MNFTLADVRQCLKKVYLDTELRSCDCPLACEQTQCRTHVVAKEKSNNSLWEFRVYNHDSKVTQIMQVADFTIEDLLGAVGGILGLTIGASSLSVVELIVYCVLYILRKVH